MQEKIQKTIRLKADTLKKLEMEATRLSKFASTYAGEIIEEYFKSKERVKHGPDTKWVLEKLGEQRQN